MKKFSEIREAREKNAVFTFGRFNPPTTGHEKLIMKVASVAKKNSAQYFIYPSHSQNPKKDPLPHSLKIAYMRKMFSDHKKNIVASNDRTAFDIAVALYNKGFTSIIMVVGSDRVQEFESLLNKYNNVEGRHGFYNFTNISVVSAGDRDPDAEGVTGMSASKMRAAASANDFNQFKLGLPMGFSGGAKLFADVRKNMGIRESFIPHTEQLTEEDIFRDMYVRGEVFKIGDTVSDNYTGVSGKVVRRGTNYLTFAEEDGTIHKRWLYELQEDTMGQLIKSVLAKTTQKKGYEAAAAVLKSVIDRKKKEAGGKLKHGVEYYAAQVAKSLTGKFDARELAKTYETQYESVKQHKGKSEEKEDPREIGTDARRETTQSMTPGQPIKSFTEHSYQKKEMDLIEENQYRVGSEKYFEFFNEKRDAYQMGIYKPEGFDKDLMEGDLGKFGEYQGQPVPLDCPMMFEEKDVELNKPKVGGPKKYYVYVKNDKGNVVKVTFGDTTGLKVKIDDPEARKNFSSRHNCPMQKDKTTAAYWSCNLPRYAKQLGLSGGGSFYW